VVASSGAGARSTLTADDWKAVSAAPSVRAAAPCIGTKAAITYDDASWVTVVTGTTPEYARIRAWPFEAGALFTSDDVLLRRKKVVLGQTVRDRLFGAQDNPVGSVLRIRSVPFDVIGVLDRKGTGAAGNDLDDVALVPLFALEPVNKPLSLLLVDPSGPGAEEEVASLLRIRHLLGAGEDDFVLRAAPLE
jgi:putative ABC transport system permease protein